MLVAPGGVVTGKVLTTPRQEEGVRAAAEQALERAGLTAGAVDSFVHGSTIATNALLERRLGKTAFLVTKGFRDLLWLARQSRPDLYRLCTPPVTPVVPRSRCFEIDERMGPHGVVRPLDEGSVHEVADRLAKLKVEAVAICLLFSFLDPSHERRTVEILRERLPDVSLIASHEAAAEVREYERGTTVAVDAALVAPTSRYLTSLRHTVEAAGLPEPLIMLSSGGVATLEQASAHPATMLLSGPAGGVVAARFLAELEGDLPAIGFDMGGTSCDTFLLTDEKGQLPFTVDRRVEGLPIRLPMLDIHTVGSGGGSIAWVDHGGALHVGPQSSGADPGPACYGRGGGDATVTDANLILGWLPAEHPIAGGVSLDRTAAHDALEALAKRAGYASAHEAAEGIADVTVNNLVQALRVISVERGHDPVATTLIAFGGAGPLHACALAESLGASRVLCTAASGVLSALGLASADRRVDRARTLLRALDSLGADELAAAARELAGRDNGHQLRCVADLRYQGQSFELMVPFAPGEGPSALVERFHAEHQRRYGHAAPGRPIELVTLRTAVVSPGPPVSLTNGHAAGTAGAGTREVRIAGRSVNADVYPGDLLMPGVRISGPAIVEYPETTCAILPGWSTEVDRHGLLRLELAR